MKMLLRVIIAGTVLIPQRIFLQEPE